ncbi:MAG: succinate--CoA ligase subunit beta [Alkalinema sp. FL-bin-369]|nr:succinate--CoA ligase subunit beta [Leptolyngbyaceae cyanobacterium LF-bin-369]
MDLLEYQAKELFRSVGIPVLVSQRIERVQDLKQLTIPYPIVLKSQVYVGGRGRLGGIRFVDNTIDAIAAAQMLFQLPLMGEIPKLLLAEAKFSAAQEFYLAVTLNRSLRRLVLLGSMQGGSQVRSTIKSAHQVVVEGDFSAFYARRLALDIGLSGALMTTVSAIIEKMYYLLVEKDLDLLEINPLGVGPEGDVMALDGKISVNDGALGRHPDLAELSPIPLLDLDYPLLTVQPTMHTDGVVGIICNGSGLTMATMDGFYDSGGKPKAFLNLGSETNHQWQTETLCDRLVQGLSAMAQQPGIQVVLVNLVSGVVPGESIAEALLRGVAAMSGLPAGTALSSPHVICRWAGPDYDRAASLLSQSSIGLCEELDITISQVFQRVKLKKI